MKRTLVLLALVGLVACEREPFSPAGGSLPQHMIVDGAHNDGNPFFFWLPPLAPNPNATGVFDAALAPRLLLCERSAGPGLGGYANCEEGTAHAVFSGADVTVEPGHYQVQVRRNSLDNNVAYRFQVNIDAWGGTVVLGVADVELVATGNETPQNDDVIAIVAASPTIPVKFRIEEGALCHDVDDPCAAGGLGPDGGALTIDDGDGIIAGFELAQGAIDFNITVILRIVDQVPCLTGTFELQPGLCLELLIDLGGNDPPAEPLELNEAVLAICLANPASPFAAFVEYWQQHDDADAEGPLDAGTPTQFALNCEDALGSALGALGKRFPALELAYRKLVAPWYRPAKRYVVAPLYAGDIVGASIRDLPGTLYTLLVPTHLDIVAGNDQTAPPGATLPIDPTVLVTSRHADTNGDAVMGVPVVWTVLSGGGSLEVINGNGTTTAEGESSVRWTLGPDEGQNTLEAAANGETVIFTAHAVPRIVAFLSPLGESSSLVNTPNLGLTVSICQEVNGDCDFLRSFSAEELKDPSDPHYHVKWDTGTNPKPNVPGIYRIEVIEAGGVIGSARVQVARPNQAVPGILRVQPNSSLPIKFRVQ